MSDLVDQAMVLAARAHAGQVDKVGAPYIEHPGRVAGHVARHAAAEDLEAARAVAWLHDVVEDTPVTLTELTQQFPPEIVAAVDAITKRAGEDREAYYQRVRTNRIARTVKHADLDDNTDPTRTAQLDPAARDRLAAKYAHARAVLQRTDVRDELRQDSSDAAK